MVGDGETRSPQTGSASTRWPSTSSSTDECPYQVSASGAGVAGAGSAASGTGAAGRPIGPRVSIARSTASSAPRVTTSSGRVLWNRPSDAWPEPAAAARSAVSRNRGAGAPSAVGRPSAARLRVTAARAIAAVGTRDRRCMGPA